MINKHLMTRTVSIKLLTTMEQHRALGLVQKEFIRGCNKVSNIAFANQCYNRVGLHHLAYYVVRNGTDLGSQMICNSIHATANSYKVLKDKKRKQVPIFKPTSSVHYDKRTYTIMDDTISLYTLSDVFT